MNPYNERDAISQILQNHMVYMRGAKHNFACWCGFESQNLTDWSDHVAETIINATVTHR